MIYVASAEIHRERWQPQSSRPNPPEMMIAKIARRVVAAAVMTVAGYVWLAAAIWITATVSTDDRAYAQRTLAIIGCVVLGARLLAALLGRWGVWALTTSVSVLVLRRVGRGGLALFLTRPGA
jgi:hypothetical protein